METKIIIEYLNEKSTTIVKKKVIIEGGIEYYVGDPHRTSYINSETGRIALRNEIPDPYYSSIMDIWGENPTVIDNIEPIE